MLNTNVLYCKCFVMCLPPRLTLSYRGLIKGAENLVNGEGTLDQNFDFIAGTVLTAGGAALGARAVAGGKVSGKVVHNGYKEIDSATSFRAAKGLGKIKREMIDPNCRRRRSLEQNAAGIFDTDLVNIPNEYIVQLPASLSEVKTANLSNPGKAFDAIFQIFLILKLMKIGHPNSKPYYNEICSKFYPNDHIKNCHSMLYSAIAKYNTQEENGFDGAMAWQKLKNANDGRTSILLDSLDALFYEMGHVIDQTSLGIGIERILCQELMMTPKLCYEKLHTMRVQLQTLLQHLKKQKFLRRFKRCTPRMFSRRIDATPEATAQAKLSK